ncbi:MAG: ribonuclease HII [Elusimicrobia bacterium]|nr:ribonuclease HII [Elusimicrobiota bacterium]
MPELSETPVFPSLRSRRRLSVSEKSTALLPLAEFDFSIIKKHGCEILIGVDEAGRGPLAGPVVAAAAWIPAGARPNLSCVRDSKTLSASKRLLVFRKLISEGVRFGFGFASAAQIDSENILNATFKAMSCAVARLVKHLEPEQINLPEQPLCGSRCSELCELPEILVLVDGPHKIRNFSFRQMPVVSGDAKSMSVACAGIFAKVIRDRWMDILDIRHPGYGFSKHKGYGTREHLNFLKEKGPSPVHRKTFAPVKERTACGR